MAAEHATARYRQLYAVLLRLYPRSFHQRFGDGMLQTFSDLCREREEAGSGLLAYVFWVFLETSGGIAREWTTVMMRRKNIVRIALATAGLLMVPLVAMQFTDEVAWSFVDFLAAGVLLFGAGLAYELLANKARSVAHRSAIGLAVVAGLLLVWMNLAVGLIGSEDNAANGLYVLVFAVAFLGAILARFRPHGMSRTMFATALAQALVPVIALVIWRPEVASLATFSGMFVVNAFFVVLFVGSALLFRQAAADHNSRPDSELPLS